MGIATGLTASRMQQIIDYQIASGAVDLSGKLIFTREDGSSFDAGTVKGEKGDPSNYPAGGMPTTTSPTYVRVATLDGLNISSGASLQFILSGVGGYGTPRRGTVLVHVAQRGVDVIDLKAWSWGLDEAAADSVKIYTRKLGTFLFEVWVRVGAYTPNLTVSELSKWRALVNMDSNTVIAPTSPALVEWTIERSDLPQASSNLAGAIQIAINAEALAGIDDVRAITPATLRYLTREATIAKGSSAERDAYFGVPSTDPDRVSLANRKLVWYNTDYNWLESYYAVTGLSGLTAVGLIAGSDSGWYPIGDGPHGILYTNGGQAFSGAGNFTNWRPWGNGASPDMQSWKNTPGNNADGSSLLHRATSNAAMQTFIAGRWAVDIAISYPNGTGTAVGSLRVNIPGVGDRTRQIPIPLLSGYGQIVKLGFTNILIPKFGYIFYRNDSGTLTMGGSSEDHMSLRYVSPPLIAQT